MKGKIGFVINDGGRGMTWDGGRRGASPDTGEACLGMV